MTANAPPPLASQLTAMYSGFTWVDQPRPCPEDRQATHLDQICIPRIATDVEVVICRLFPRWLPKYMSYARGEVVCAAASEWGLRYFDARTNRPAIRAHALTCIAMWNVWIRMPKSQWGRAVRPRAAAETLIDGLRMIAANEVTFHAPAWTVHLLTGWQHGCDGIKRQHRTGYRSEHRCAPSRVYGKKVQPFQTLEIHSSYPRFLCDLPACR